MELQNISKIKKQGANYSMFKTLGDEKKVDYQLLDKSLARVKYDVNIFETFLSPKIKLNKKTGRRKMRVNTILRNKRIMRNNTSISSNKIFTSSSSLDKIIKKRYSITKMEIIEKNEKGDFKPKKVNKSRNFNKYSQKNNQKENEGIFITEFKSNNDNNPINTIQEPKKREKKYKTDKSYSLKNKLPPIKTKTAITNKSNLKTIDYINKIINEDNKNANVYLKTETPMIKKHKKLLSIDEEGVLNMIKRNRRIVNNINTIKNNFENIMVNFETKYKYLNWKYGIADMDKYFIDIDSYKKDSEELINNKKAFYDKLDDMVDKINQQKELNDLQSIKKQFGININKKKDNIDYNSINVDESDKLYLKGKKIKNLLKELFERKRIEKLNRGKIKNILDRSRDRCNIINKNFNSFQMKEIKQLMMIQNYDNKKLKEKNDKEKNNKEKNEKET